MKFLITFIVLTTSMSSLAMPVEIDADRFFSYAYNVASRTYATLSDEKCHVNKYSKMKYAELTSSVTGNARKACWQKEEANGVRFIDICLAIENATELAQPCYMYSEKMFVDTKSLPKSSF